VIVFIPPADTVQVAAAPFPISPAAGVIVMVGADVYPVPAVVITKVIVEALVQLKELFKYKRVVLFGL
jgi:hypothetical protein